MCDIWCKLAIYTLYNIHTVALLLITKDKMRWNSIYLKKVGSSLFVLLEWRYDINIYWDF